MGPAPLLPPGFVAARCCGDPVSAAIAAAEAGADPGTVLHADLSARCDCAIILTPDRPITDATLLHLGAGAVSGALAALVPPGLPIEAAPPGIRLNGAEVARLTVRRAATKTDDLPDWLVLGIAIAVDLKQADPGEDPDRTCLAEEGSDAEASDVLVAICCHLLAAFDAWRDAPAQAAA